MEVVALKDFRDLEAKTMRKANEKFEITPERFKAINATRYGQLVKEAPKTRVKKTTTKEME